MDALRPHADIKTGVQGFESARQPIKLVTDRKSLGPLHRRFPGVFESRKGLSVRARVLPLLHGNR